MMVMENGSIMLIITWGIAWGYQLYLFPIPVHLFLMFSSIFKGFCDQTEVTCRLWKDLFKSHGLKNAILFVARLDG